MVYYKKQGPFRNLFSDSKVNIRTERKRHLDAAISSNEFRIKYVTEKVNEWCEELKPLPNFAKSQSQALYVAFCFGEQNKHNYLLREFMKPVDEVIQNDLLPSKKLIELNPHCCQV